MKKIIFQTKQKSKDSQLKEFLKLSPEQRVWHFFYAVFYFNQFPAKNETKKKNKNFILVKE
jgi:hypothetical protein